MLQAVRRHCDRLRAERQFQCPVHQISRNGGFGLLAMNGNFSKNTSLALLFDYLVHKAGIDQLISALHQIYHLQVCITNCKRDVGAWSFLQRLFSLVIFKAEIGGDIQFYRDDLKIRACYFDENNVKVFFLGNIKGTIL